MYNDKAYTEEVNIGNITFKRIPGHSKELGAYEILVDKNTMVQYLNRTSDHGSGLVVIVDADGKPILYEGEVE